MSMSQANALQSATSSVAAQMAHFQALFGVKRGRFSALEEEDPCDIGEAEGKALLALPDCAPINTIFGPSGPEGADMATSLTAFKKLCETPNCLGRFVATYEGAVASAECKATGEAPPANLMNFMCMKREPQTTCLDWMFGATRDPPVGTYKSFCDEAFNTTWATGMSSGNAGFICCALAEGGCCMTEVMSMGMDEQELANFASSVDTLCGQGNFAVENTCVPVDVDACFVKRILKFTEFTGEGRVSNLVSSLATDLNVNATQITVDSITAPVGEDISVGVSISTGCAEMDALIATWNGETLATDTFGAGTTLNVNAVGVADGQTSQKIVDSGVFDDTGCATMSTLVGSNAPDCASACTFDGKNTCDSVKSVHDCMAALPAECAITARTTAELTCQVVARCGSTTSSASILAGSAVLSLLALF